MSEFGGRLVAFALAAAVCVLPIEAGAARRVFGTLIGPAVGASVSVQTPLGPKAYELAGGVTVHRGQTGLDTKPAALADLRPGDYLALTLNDTGKVNDISGSYGVVNGKFARVQSGKMTLADGRKVPFRPGVQVILSDGSLGSINDIKPGSDIACRVSPESNEAWCVAVLSAARSAPVAPVKPKITAITYSPSTDLKPGESLTVEMQGTPGGKASFDVMFLMPFTPMKEISPGCYRADVKIPAGKSVSNSPLVGYLTVGDAKASAVQASKLITVAKPTENPAPIVKDPANQVGQVVTPSQNISAPVVAQVQPRPVTVPVSMVLPKAPEKPRNLQQIVLTSPTNGAKMKSAILVRGKASPDSKVSVAITYNNGLSGLLKLAGQVATQTLAVDKDGTFRFGPIALEGPLATKGLKFTIKAYYADREDHGTAVVMAIGDRL